MYSLKRMVILLVIFIYSVGFSESQAQYVEFETSWERAKKKSKKSGKPVLAIFSHRMYDDMDRTVFDNDGIVLELEKDFVVYKYNPKKDKSPWFIRGCPSVVISDHLGKRYKHIIHFQGADSLLQSIYEYDKEPRLSYYEDNYVKNENDIEFLEEYVRYALKYNLGLTGVYFDYYSRIEGYNCLKIKCITESLVLSLPKDEFFDNYHEMLATGCDSTGLEKRVFSVYQKEYIFAYGRDADEERYYEYEKPATMTAEFLGKGERYIDSIVTYYTWWSKSNPYNKSIDEKMKVNSLLLDCFEYNLENTFTQDSLQSLLFDLAVTVDNKQELNRLADVILEKPVFINDAAIVETLAIVYYRLGQDEEGSKMISRANDIAVKNGIRYRTIIPEMKNNGLLQPVNK